MGMSTVLNAVRCANCGYERVEAYCGRCGQRTRRSRFAMRPLLRQAADDALNLDQGLLHTVLALSRHPGRAVAEYLGGRTRPYTNPAKYLVIWAALTTVAFHYSGILDAQLEVMGEVPDPELDAAVRRLAEVMMRYFNLLLILIVPVLAAFSRLFFRQSGYNYTEHLIFNVYVYAHQNALFVATLPVYFLVLTNPYAYLALYMLLTVLYYIWACRDFFRVSTLAATARGLLVNAFGQVGFWLLIGAVLGWTARGASG